MATAAALPFKRGLLLALAALIAVAATAVAPAPAGGSSLTCPSSVEHPFLRWLDPAAYTLLADGDFEGKRTSWSFSGGTKVVSGNEPFKVHSTKDARSLSIPAGGSALSPVFCAGVGEPVVRFFAVGGSLTSSLKVEVLYRTPLGTTSQTIALVPRMGEWAPTLQTPLLGNVLGLTSLDGLTTTVQLRFTAIGRAGWKIDDVYVDPWKVT